MNIAFAWHEGVSDFLRPCLAWLQANGSADLRYLASHLGCLQPDKPHHGQRVSRATATCSAAATLPACPRLPTAAAASAQPSAKALAPSAPASKSAAASRTITTSTCPTTAAT
ncbi:hypothetical protein ABPG75_008667 [Micractinium tetrahymenae]